MAETNSAAKRRNEAFRKSLAQQDKQRYFESIRRKMLEAEEEE